MIKLSKTSPRLRRTLPPLVALSIFGYFTYHLIQGERGLFSWYRLQNKTDKLQQELSILQSEKETLERQVSLLNPSHLCPDMLEERVRSVLNFADPNDLIIFENTSVKEKEKKK